MAIENTPQRRVTDQGIRGRLRRWWYHNGYRDLWLIFISVAVLAGVNENANRIDDVQTSRIELCDQTNTRHDDAIQILNEQIAKLPVGQQEQAERSRKFTISLIEAITPKRDCNTVVK